VTSRSIGPASTRGSVFSRLASDGQLIKDAPSEFPPSLDRER
jgi:hypothetical protein